jgi:hypothetical protein
MRGTRFYRGLCAVLFVLLLPATTWGYFFDDRREMSLSGFAYSRATFALAADNIRSTRWTTTLAGTCGRVSRFFTTGRGRI